MAMDSQIMYLNLKVKRFAVICGRVSKEMASTMPTMRRHATIVRAMNTIRAYSKKVTGSFCERANSGSKAMATIGRRNRAKNQGEHQAEYAEQKDIAPGDGQDVPE